MAEEGLGQSFQLGQEVVGRVSRLRSDGALIDLGGGQEGYLPIREIGDWAHQRDISLHEDLELHVYVASSEEQDEVLELSLSPPAWSNVASAFSVGDEVKGTVTAITDDGGIIDLGPLDGWLPDHEVSWRIPAPALREVLEEGQSITVRITLINRTKKQLWVSLRDSQLGWDEWHELTRSIRDGETRTGQVNRIHNNGMAVDIGGIEGWLPATQARFGSDVEGGWRFAIGQRVSVDVGKLNRRQRRIPLQLNRKRTTEVARRFRKGDSCPATITGFGRQYLFVEYDGAAGVVAMPHLRGGDPSSYYRIGDEVAVVFVRHDRGNGLLRFSADGTSIMQQAMDKGLRKGDVVDATVIDVRDTRLMLDVQGLVGYVDRKHLSWDSNMQIGDFQSGDATKAMYFDNDFDSGTLMLSRRDAYPTEWSAPLEHIRQGEWTSAVVTGRHLLGITVEVNGITTQIPRISLPDQELDPREQFHDGQPIDAYVKRIDPFGFYLGLTMMEEDSSDDDLAELINGTEFTKAEFKENMPYRTNRRDDGLTVAFLSTIVGFLNTCGGTLLMGVEDMGKENRGKPVGVQPTTRGYKHFDDALLFLDTKINDRIGTGSSNLVELEFREYQRMLLLVAKCQPSDRRWYLDDREFYGRVGRQTKKMTRSEEDDHWNTRNCL
ncbi:MAG: S1 RNA-binding domain-containing protein [Chloroflexi bacterium]|nr:S1 RNA-binding domain-containing protein [Chloroflexota bacterium]